MTDPYTGVTHVEDIDDDTVATTAELDRQADAILAGAGMSDTSGVSESGTGDVGARPLRQAVREDAAQARDWGRHRAESLRGAVEAEPMKATLYALGIGVVIGLLAAR